MKDQIEKCKKCEELNKKYPSNENWKVKCAECGMKAIKNLTKTK